MVVFQVRGLLAAVFTPLKGQALNLDLVPAYAQYLSKAGIKGVLVGGTNGQNVSLRVSDRKRLIDSWVEAGKIVNMHIMVQVGGAAFPDVLDLAKHCSEVGAGSILTLPELYFRPQSISELVSYVSRVSEAAPNLPILYYHFPIMSKVDINMPKFVIEASKHIPNFKGIKSSGGNLIEAIEVLKNLKDDQEIFIGSDKLIAPATLLGFKSFIGGSINVFPQLAQNIVDAVKKNDISLARELQNKLSIALDNITEEGARVPAMKAAMTIVTGIDVGPSSLPQEPVSDEIRRRIQEKLKSLEII